MRGMRQPGKWCGSRCLAGGRGARRCSPSAAPATGGRSAGFGSPEYAREELRAEISAMMTGEQVGVGHDPQRGAAEHRATTGAPANPPAQELFAGPPPRPFGGTRQPRPVLAISVPSADDVGPFFRVGAKNPDRCLRSRFFLSAFGPPLPTPRQASPMTTAQPLTIGAHPKKRGPEACYPLSPFFPLRS